MLKISLKKWAFLSIIIIFNLIIALKTSMEFFYFFFWFLLSVVAVSFLWVMTGYFGTELSLIRKTTSKLEEDDILEIETIIDNKGFLPAINFVLEDRLPCAGPQEKEKRISLEYLGGGSTKNLKYRCSCPQRGRYELGPFYIYFFDPWGLFYLKKACSIYSELYVYPRTFNIKKFPSLMKGIAPWFGIEASRVSGDEHEFYGIREYKAGDPIKKIHWFSTARKNRLIVKQFQQQVFFRATIIFNLNKERNFGTGKESVVEYTVKIAASVAKYLIERNVSLELIAHTGEMVHIPFNKGSGHLEDIMKALATAQAESNVSLDEIFQEFSAHIPSDSSLIVIMLDKDWEFLSALLSLSVRNISLVPLILASASFLHAPRRQGIKELDSPKLPQVFNFAPIFFSCGENLEQSFLKY